MRPARSADPKNEALLDAANRMFKERINDGTYQQIYDKLVPRHSGGSIAGS